MSVAHLRDGALATRYNDRVSSLHRRFSRLRALNIVTATLTQHVGLPPALGFDIYAEPPPPLRQDEVHLLHDYDLQQGRHVTDASFRITLQDLLPPSEPNVEPAKEVDQVGLPAYPAATTVESHGRNDEATAHSEHPTDATNQNPPISVHVPLSPAASKDETLVSIVAPPVVHDLTDDVLSSPPSTSDALSASSLQPAEPSPNSSVHEPPATSSTEYDVKSTASLPTVPDAAELDSVPVETSFVTAQDAQHSSDEDSTSPDQQLRREQAQAARLKRLEVISPPKAVINPPKMTAPPAARLESTSPSEANVAAESHDVSMVDAPEDVPPSTERPKPADAGTVDVDKVQVDLLPTQGPTENAMHESAEPEVHTVDDDSQHVEPISAPTDSAKVASSSTTSRRPTSTTSLVRRAPTETNELPKLSTAHAAGYIDLRGAAEDPRRDYLEPLYRFQVQSPPGGKSVGELVHRATKVVDTLDQLSGVREIQDYKILKRLYALQYTNSWSLRQMEPPLEPVVPQTHQDHMLRELKWMRTDFRAERKIKRSLALFFSTQCARWVHSDSVGRAALQCIAGQRPVEDTSIGNRCQESVSSRPFKSPASSKPPTTTSLDLNIAPDLVPAEQLEHSPTDDLDMPPTPRFAIIPESLAEIVHIAEDSAQQSQMDDFWSAVKELPLLAPFAIEADIVASPDEVRRAAIPAISKFSGTKVLAAPSHRPRKRSRYDFEDEDSDITNTSVGAIARPAQAARKNTPLPPEETNVALFNTENKHIKDRLHANTAFRPPSEHPMPTIQFYEFRSASQWTWEDDQKLRELVKDYCFNWSLISAELALPSNLQGAADRRTPWECFERWVELETLPTEMRKTYYFRTWNNRIETAANNVDARYQAQVQLHSQSANPAQVPMRRKIQPVRVEKRRSSRYLHAIDAMRKLARKREQQQHKQAEAQKAASLRKQQENVQPRASMHTPQEFSKIRHDRDVALAARQEKYREHMVAQQKAAHLQRANGQYTTQQQAMNMAQQRAGAPAVAQMQPGQQTVQAQAQGVANGAGANGTAVAAGGTPRSNYPGTYPAGIPQAANIGANGQMPPAQSAMANKAYQDRILAMYGMGKGNQRAGQQFQMPPQHLLSPGGSLQANGLMNSPQATAAAMQASNAKNAHATAMRRTPSGNPAGSGQGVSASPQMRPPPVPGMQPSQLSSGMIPAVAQIKHSLQAAHPQATPQQIEQLVKEQMQRQYAQTQRQNAINAAAGNVAQGNGQELAYPAPGQSAYQTNGMNGSNANGSMAVPSPQQQLHYAALMRQRVLQQQSQMQPQTTNANGASPKVTNQTLANTASPKPAPAIANLQGAAMNSQRPVSRSATPMGRVASPNGAASPAPGAMQPQQQSPLVAVVKPQA